MPDPVRTIEQTHPKLVFIHEYPPPYIVRNSFLQLKEQKQFAQGSMLPLRIRTRRSTHCATAHLCSMTVTSDCTVTQTRHESNNTLKSTCYTVSISSPQQTCHNIGVHLKVGALHNITSDITIV